MHGGWAVFISVLSRPNLPTWTQDEKGVGYLGEAVLRTGGTGRVA